MTGKQFAKYLMPFNDNSPSKFNTQQFAVICYCKISYIYEMHLCYKRCAWKNVSVLSWLDSIESLRFLFLSSIIKRVLWGEGTRI